MNNFFAPIEELKLKWKILAIFSLVTILLSVIFCFFIIEPSYEAKTKLFIGKEKFKKTADGYTNEEVQMYQKLLKSYCEVITSDDLMEKSIYDAEADVLLKDARKNVEIRVIKDTQVIEVLYSDATAQAAYDIMYYITKNFISNASKLYSNSNIIVLEQPKVVEKSVVNNMNVIIPIVAFLGLAVGVIYVLVSAYLKQTFDNKESVEKMLCIYVMGIIPDEHMENKS